MNTQEKTFARCKFQLKIHEADGQKFEDIFTSIMNYKEKEDFQQIKPWGNIGDRKNDGYIKSKGMYYQVYAPEEIRTSYTSAVNKLKKDFDGLMVQWSPIKEYYFVVNDKYKGVNADCEQTIQELKVSHNLDKSSFLTAKDLENYLFELDDDQIFTIAGFIPDPAKIKNLDYSILNEVIVYIMQLSVGEDDNPKIKAPNWDKKIEFNGLSEYVSQLLNNGNVFVSKLETYLKNNSDFLADSLRDRMNEIYLQEKENNIGDKLFLAIVNRASPKEQILYQTIVIIIMAKYFETCDIFEEPSVEETK